ncbi:MAG: pyridoxamine 5'-phosphate oxidase family protein [Sandaracinaceae bacterium]|nr:pyridoxamine 5'-phosphate oxidase family protein [Sandaracinaceae bacterium]
MSTLTPTDRTRLRRRPQRGHFDRATIDAILDATPLCHVGYVIDGAPAVTPTLQWRHGDRVYWHGASASRALKASEGMDVCLTVSLLDGLVLARSAFHHSANYRSVMIYGRAIVVDDPTEKRAALEAFLERLYPGRWATLRPVQDKEIKATRVLSLPIEEASAKIRDAGPVDDEEDYDVPVWAGVLPLQQTFGAPEPDPRNLPGVTLDPASFPPIGHGHGHGHV